MSRKKSKATKGIRRDPILELYFEKHRHRAISLLKGKRSYSQARILLPKLGLKSMHSDLKFAVTGTVKPSNWDDIIMHHFLPPSKDWVEEFGWLAHGFVAEAGRLNSFLESRKQFGCAFVLGDLETAKAILGRVTETHGLSLWLAEREFMLLQSETGFEGHKQKLSEIQASMTNSLAGYLITTSSNRLELHVTPEAFERTCKEDLDELRAGGHHVFASWIELHIAPWSFGWVEDKANMLQSCGGKTIVDRYDRAMKILSCIPFEVLDQKDRNRLCIILRDLAAVIDDRQLAHLVGVLEETGGNPVDPRTDRYFTALDAFVAGDYIRSAKLAEALIVEEPTCFEFIFLLAKAAASCAQPFIVSIPEHCVARSLFSWLFQIAQNRIAIELPLAELNLLALKLGDNHLGLSVRQFAQYEESGLCNATAANQIAVQSKIDVRSLIGNHESLFAIGPIGTTIEKYSQHVSVQLELYGNGTSLLSLPIHQVAPLFASLARAKRLALEGKHSDVLTELEPLVGDDAPDSCEIQVHAVVVARLQFEALIGLDRAEDAARAITKQYLQNANNLRHVQFERLIEGCIAGRWPTLRTLPCWPILVTLHNGSEQDVYEAVDDLLLEHRCSSPLSFVDGTIPCTMDELRIILRDTLVPKVISRGALWNRTAEERRQMRKQCLQKLYSISLADQGFVVEELSQLEHAQLLEAAYRNIEGPKFELDYKAVNRELARIFDGTFARYSEYRSYEAKGGTLATEGELLTFAREGTEIKVGVERKTETSALLLRKIIRGAFVEYLLDTSAGINAFLGTRIRHGALENQFTRVLGAHSLLALKSGSGNYVCDTSVRDHLMTVEPEKREVAINAYVEFTLTINSLVSELITSVLRVRIPESILSVCERSGIKTSELRSDMGLLDFSRLFSEEIPNRLDAIEFSSVTSILSEAEAIFLREANATFVTVREYLERNVAERIRVALQRLEDAIQAALPDGVQRAALRAEILAAKGKYTEDLKIISTWFSAAKPLETGLGSLREIVDMAGRVVNFASNGKLGALLMQGFHDEKPAADCGRLMYEVISILLRNVVQHSRIETGQQATFEHVVDGHRRRLTLRNRVCDEAELDMLVKRAEEAIARPFDDWALGTAPGGTGFVRIRKLLKQAGFSSVEFIVRGLGEPCRFEAQINYSK